MITEKHAAPVHFADKPGDLYVVRASDWEADRFVIVRAPSALQAAQKILIRDGVEVLVYSLTLLTHYTVTFTPNYREG